jgi:predicted nucleic acid-binding protein
MSNRTKYILDAGPLIAFLNRDDHFHNWAVATLSILKVPPLICEAVMTEVCWHLRASPVAVSRVLEMPARGELVVQGILANKGINLAGKIRKYESRMDLADACVLRLAELVPGSVVITLDKKDFSIYRMHRDDQVKLLHP